jgi:hypothetical protein
VLSSAAAGLVASLAFLTRPEFALFLPAGLAVLLLGRSRRVACAAVFLLCFALLPAAWTARNVVSLGRPVVATTHGGYTHRLPYNYVFYDRVVQNGGDTWTAADESFGSWSARVAAETAGMSEIARDAHNSRMANAFMISDPPRAAKIACYGAASFWRPWPRAAGTLETVALAVFFIALAILAAAGLAFLRGGGPFVPVVLYLCAAESLVHMYYWSNVRMRVPFHPLLAVCAGCAVAAILARKKALRAPRGVVTC